MSLYPLLTVPLNLLSECKNLFLKVLNIVCFSGSQSLFPYSFSISFCLSSSTFPLPFTFISFFSLLSSLFLSPFPLPLSYYFYPFNSFFPLPFSLSLPVPVPSFRPIFPFPFLFSPLSFILFILSFLSRFLVHLPVPVPFSRSSFPLSRQRSHARSPFRVAGVAEPGIAGVAVHVQGRVPDAYLPPGVRGTAPLLPAWSVEGQLLG